MNPFVHLHVHSDFSVLDGKSKIPALVDLAIADGMKGMALTDHGVMYGVKEFSDYCAKVNKSRKKEGLEPFKPILGCEMYVAHGKKEDKTKGNYHLVVLAKNYNGYKNLIKLVSRAWVDGFPTVRIWRNTMKTLSYARHVLVAKFLRRFWLVILLEQKRRADGTTKCLATTSTLNSNATR